MTGTYPECVSAVLAAAKANGHGEVHETNIDDHADIECSDCSALARVYFGNAANPPSVVMEQNALVNEKCADVAAGRGLY